MSRVRTTHSTIGECYQRRRKCAAVTPECSRTEQCASKARSHWGRMRLHACGTKDDESDRRNFAQDTPKPSRPKSQDRNARSDGSRKEGRHTQQQCPPSKHAGEHALEHQVGEAGQHDGAPSGPCVETSGFN